MKFFKFVPFVLSFLLLSAGSGFAQTISRVDITADTIILRAGQTLTATARAKDVDGNIISGVQFTWSTANAALATVDGNGVITSLRPGTVQIRARTSTNVQGVLNLTIIPARIDLTGPEIIRLNSGATLTAAAFDIRNNTLPGVAFTWASDNTAVATVTNQGVVQAVGLGEAVITAAVSGFSDSHLVRVQRSADFTLDPVVTTDLNEGSNSQIQSIGVGSNMNARGDIAFVANLSGKTTAVLRDSPGQVKALARTGDVAPFGGTYSTFTAVSMNNRGDVAFIANVANGIGPLLMLARGNETTPLLVSGDVLEVGGNVGAITLQPDGLDDNGFVTVQLTVTNPTYSGVFRISPETGADPLIRTFDEVSIGTPTAFGPVSVSPNGRVAVLVTAGARRGIYIVSATAPPSPVIVDGTNAPNGTPFTTFIQLRNVSDSELFFTGTAQGMSTSLYRVSGAALSVAVPGGRESASRTITITTLQGASAGSVLFSGTVSDLGTGIFAWSGGNLRSVGLRNATMPDGEILTRLDSGLINSSGDVLFSGVTDRHLNATYRVSSQGTALRWATGSVVPVVANYNVVFSSTLRPGRNVTYFLAGSPTGLFQKTGDVVTPVAIPGMRSSRGVYSAVSLASSNANGDAVFVATSLDLTRLTTTTVMYRYAAGAVTESIVFGQQVDIPGLGARTITNAGLTSLAINNAGQVAFVGTIDGRQNLFVANSDVQIYAQVSSPSPAGGTFTSMSNLQLTQSGAVAFSGAVSGGPAGIFLARTSQMTTIATTNDYINLSVPAVGGETIYFNSTRRTDNINALWSYSNGSVQQVVSVGSMLPINVTATSIPLFSAQEDGTVAFYATATLSGIFTRRPDGTMSTVALLAETTPLSGRFTAFGVMAIANSVIVINSTLTPDRSAVFLAWPAGRQPSAPISSADYSVVNRSAVSLRTEGLSSSTSVGYASVRPNIGANAPSGLAIFSLRRDNVLVSEATVPATALVQEGRIYAEANGPANTGIAIANPNTQPATLTFYFTNEAGADYGAGTTTIPGGGQMARFLDQAPFSGGTSMRGSFTFASSQPVSVIALRSYVNERSDFLMTTLPVASLSGAGSTPVIFPHFADGQGWVSQVVLVNPTSNVLTGNMQFLGRQGSTSRDYSIAPKSSYVWRTAGVAASTDTGWVRITPGPGMRSPSGLLIFSYSRNGVTVSEAGVPSSNVGNAFRLYLESAGNISTSQVGAMQTGIAIANPGNTPVTVTLDATNLSGASMGIVGTVTVPAQGQVATFVNQITGMDSLLAAQGVLRISATTAPIAVMGLRGRYNERSDFLITTIEPTNETSATTSGDRYMPHFVDSGGYTTQFILYSGTTNQSSSGSIRFYSQSGQALGLTLR